LFSITVAFSGNELKEVSLVDLDAPCGIEAPQKEDVAETTRKSAHDQWLRSLLGEPPYAFPWGEIISKYDAKRSEIRIQYKNAPGGLKRLFASLIR
jgi:hypothetical protein